MDSNTQQKIVNASMHSKLNSHLGALQTLALVSANFSSLQPRRQIGNSGHVNNLTGACPTVATHVLWDFQPGQDPKEVSALATKYGVGLGSINLTFSKTKSTNTVLLATQTKRLATALAHCKTLSSLDKQWVLTLFHFGSQTVLTTQDKETSVTVKIL